MASLKNVMETDEFVGVESVQEEKRMTELPLVEFGQISEVKEEQITTSRIERAPSDRSGRTDIVEMEVEDVEVQSVEERIAD